MTAPHAAINPLLISLLTGRDIADIPEKPTLAMRPGRYVKTIAKHRYDINEQYESNEYYLICGYYGKKRQYDLGLLVFDLKRWEKDKRNTLYAGSGIFPL